MMRPPGRRPCIKKKKSAQKSKAAKGGARKGKVGRFHAIGKATTHMAMGNEITHVKGRTLVGELITSKRLQRLAQSINPALARAFVQLQGLAMCFTKFRFRKLVLHYQPLCPSTVAGSVGAAFVPNAEVAPPATVSELLSYPGSKFGSVTEGFSVNCAGSGDRWYYTDVAVSPDPANRRQESPGNVVVMLSNGGDTAVTAGMVLLEYEVEFSELRPIRQQMCVSTQPVDGEVAISSAVTYMPVGKNLEKQIGDWRSDATSDAVIPFSDKLITRAGDYLLDYFFGVQAVVPEAKVRNDHDGEVVVSRWLDQQPEGPYPRCSKGWDTTKAFADCKSKEDFERVMSELPSATGDVTLSFWRKPTTSDLIEVLLSQTFNSTTDAYFRLAQNTNFPGPYTDPNFGADDGPWEFGVAVTSADPRVVKTSLLQVLAVDEAQW